MLEVSQQPSMIAPKLPVITLDDHSCKVCKGSKFYFWWESPERRVYSCADPDCGIFMEVQKENEVFEV